MTVGCEDEPKPKRPPAEQFTEVSVTFAAFQAAEQQYRGEHGMYFGTGDETQLDGAPTDAWKALGVRLPRRISCRYGVVAGDGDGSTSDLGPIGKKLYAADAPRGLYYYLVARCGEFGFAQRSDSPEIVIDTKR